MVIEAAGSESALARAVELAKPSAQVVIPGIYWGPVALPGLLMCLKQVSLCPTTLYGRHAGGRDVDNAAALLATTPELPATIVTHRFPLDEAVAAFVDEIVEILGPARVLSIAKELTKLHETILTGPAGDVRARLAALTIKGEFVVLIAPGDFEL